MPPSPILSYWEIWSIIAKSGNGEWTEVELMAIWRQELNIRSMHTQNTLSNAQLRTLLCLL